MQSSPDISCNRCRDRYRGRHPYCPLCGKELPQNRVSLPNLLGRYLRAAWQDGLIFLRTWWALLVQPGPVIRAHLQGDRRAFYHPVHYFLLLASVYTFLSLLAPHGQADIPPQAAGVEFWGVPLELFIRVQAKYFNIYIFLAVPAVAFFSWLFYLGREMYYGEHLIIQFYLMGELLTLNLLSLGLTEAGLSNSWVQGGIMLLLLGYFGWGYRSFFEENYFLALLKVSLAYFAGALVYGICFFLLVMLFLSQYQAWTGSFPELGG
jgi:hypothetical protein